MVTRRTCAELVELVKAKGPGALDGLDYLDEIVDIAGAAEFTGLRPLGVRLYHSEAQRKRREGKTGWMWAEPDLVLGRRPGWKLRTLVLCRAAMPGRGAGGGRPWPRREG